MLLRAMEKEGKEGKERRALVFIGRNRHAA
jgi:hypothetical protein